MFHKLFSCFFQSIIRWRLSERYSFRPKSPGLLSIDRGKVQWSVAGAFGSPEVERGCVVLDPSKKESNPGKFDLKSGSCRNATHLIRARASEPNSNSTFMSWLWAWHWIRISSGASDVIAKPCANSTCCGSSLVLSKSCSSPPQIFTCTGTFAPRKTRFNDSTIRPFNHSPPLAAIQSLARSRRVLA